MGLMLKKMLLAGGYDAAKIKLCEYRVNSTLKWNHIETPVCRQAGSTQ